MKVTVKHAIEKLLDGETVARFQAADIRGLAMAMAHNVINGDRHVIVVHSLAGVPLTIKDADLIKASLEDALLERYIITTGVTRVGNGLNTGCTLEWRVIDRANIFILAEKDRRLVKDWLARIPQPAKPTFEQPGFWGG